MESTRQQKFAKLIQKELSILFLKNQKHFIGSDLFITITMVRVTPDLKTAKIYLSIMLSTNKNKVLEDIRQKTKQIRHLLGERIKKQCRSIPELDFHIDDSAEYADKMNKLINKLDIPPLPNDDDSKKN